MTGIITRTLFKTTLGTNRILFVTACLIFGCTLATAKSLPLPEQRADTAPKAKVTFIELGSVTCLPCKMMQPVMRTIRKRYPNDVRVIFYDVWSEAGKPAGRQYGIRAVPTQVFLDRSGKEYYRHEGFLSLADVEKVLLSKGVRQ